MGDADVWRRGELRKQTGAAGVGEGRTGRVSPSATELPYGVTERPGRSREGGTAAGMY